MLYLNVQLQIIEYLRDDGDVISQCSIIDNENPLHNVFEWSKHPNIRLSQLMEDSNCINLEVKNNVKTKRMASNY